MRRIQFSVPNRHLRAIGEVTVNFALLENALARLIWELLGVPRELGESVTCELSFRNLVALVSSLYRQRSADPFKIKACEQLLTRATQAEEKRNTIVHSLWVSKGTADTVVRVKVTARKGRGLHYQSEQISVSELESIAEEALAVAADILDLAVWRVLPPSPTRSASEVKHDA